MVVEVFTYAESYFVFYLDYGYLICRFKKVLSSLLILFQMCKNAV